VNDWTLTVYDRTDTESAMTYACFGIMWADGSVVMAHIPKTAEREEIALHLSRFAERLKSTPDGVPE